MGLSSIFKRSETVSASSPIASEPGDPVQQARTRARRRLVGAAVLLTIGVLGFPLVFETRPRPVPIDIPIEIPKKEGAAPLAMPSPRPIPPVPAETAPATETMITESKADAGREIAPRPSVAPPPADSAASRQARATLPPQTAAAAKSEASRTPEPARKAADGPASPASDAARARALLDARPAAASQASAEGLRFVVQVGAFAENDAARETRAKVEKLGLKTYTQVAQTPAGNRIRVRVGPFASRAEADAALSKARAAGLNAVVLTL